LSYGKARTAEKPERTPTVREDFEAGRNAARGHKDPSLEARGSVTTGMRRADRLFQIIQYLQGRRLVTARQLAERLQVSERTVYRDVQDLVLSGVPIEGEAGVGYMLRAGFHLPPLMFTPEEMEALVTGARLVKA